MSRLTRFAVVPLIALLGAGRLYAQDAQPPRGEAQRPSRPAREGRSANPSQPAPSEAQSAAAQAPPQGGRRGGDAPLPADWAFRTVSLKHADCRDLANVLMQAAGIYRKPILVTPYEATNTLVIGADDETAARLTALVSELDVPAPPEPRTGAAFKAITLAHAQVKSAVQFLHELQPRSRAPLRIFGDERSATVWLGGDPEQVEALSKLLADLDSRPSRAQVGAQQAGECRVYALRHADAPQLAELLGNVASDLAIDARILADPRTNALVAVATEKQHARIAGLIELLDLPGERTPRPAPAKSTPATPKGG